MRVFTITFFTITLSLTIKTITPTLDVHLVFHDIIMFGSINICQVKTTWETTFNVKNVIKFETFRHIFVGKFLNLYTKTKHTKILRCFKSTGSVNAFVSVSQLSNAVSYLIQLTNIVLHRSYID